MTINEARQALRGRLEFGNDTQIRAVRFLDDVAATVEKIKAGPVCYGCKGTGTDVKWCSSCDGSGADCECDHGVILIECPECGGVGYLYTEYPECRQAVMAAARQTILLDRNALRP